MYLNTAGIIIAIFMSTKIRPRHNKLCAFFQNKENHKKLVFALKLRPSGLRYRQVNALPSLGRKGGG